MQRNADTEKNSAKPASPFDIAVHLLILIWNETGSTNYHSGSGDLIEIKLRAIAGAHPPGLMSIAGLTKIKMMIGKCRMVDRIGREPMRFYFDVRDRLAIRDGVGRDLGSVSQAVSHAKYLAADMRCLEPDIRPHCPSR